MAETPWMVPETMTPSGMVKHSTMFIHAPPGYGKSTLALTISDQCPAPWPPKELKERVWLDDIYYISVDSKGYIGFYSLNVVPRHIFDVDRLMSDQEVWKASKFVGPPTMSQAIDFAIEKAEEHIKANPNCKLVIDTWSAINRGLLVEFTHKNSKRMYGSVLDWTRNFDARMKSLGFQHVVYLSHSKAAFKGEMTEQAAATFEAGKALDNADIIPDIAGNSVGILKNECLFEGVLDVVTPPGGKERKRYLYVTATEGKEVKNRFEHIKETHGKLEPHLGKLLKIVSTK